MKSFLCIVLSLALLHGAIEFSFDIKNRIKRRDFGRITRIMINRLLIYVIGIILFFHIAIENPVLEDIVKIIFK